MSNLLNNNNRKKLLERGPKIVPNESFKLDETKEEGVPSNTTAPEQPKTKVRKNSDQITSVRVTKATRSKLNALIQMGTADNADLLIDILLDEYIENTLTKDERKTYTIILDILRKREN